MYFEYLSELHAVYKPGDRAWVCAFRLDKHCTRIIRQLRPTLVEFCCASEKHEDMRRRKLALDAHFVVPVGDNGELNYGKASKFSFLHCFPDQPAASKKYQELLTAAQTDIKKQRNRIKKAESAVTAEISSYALITDDNVIVDPDLV